MYNETDDRVEAKHGTTATNPDEYWALLEPEKLANKVKEKRKEYLEFFRESGILARIKTSYAYHHGLYYNGHQIGDARIQCGGEEDEWDLVGVNQFRSVLSLLKTYVCAPDIAWDAIAKKSSYSTIEATKEANKYLDCLTSDPDTGLQSCRKQAVEEAIVLSAGYVWVFYDETLGEEIDATEEGTVLHKGDFRLLNPSILDIAYSLDVPTFNDSPWVITRRKENKFDLIAQYPALKEEILKGSASNMHGLDDIFEMGVDRSLLKKSPADSVWVYYFYHRETPSLPKGRFARFVTEKAFLRDGALQGCIPVHQLLPSRWLLSSFGYSMSWDLAGPQEALHLAANIIISNQNKFGGNHVQFPSGSPVRIGDIEGIGTVFQTDGEIKSVPLLNNPAELFKSVDLWGATIEKLSGINAAARGQPTPSMHAARAIEFTEQRTQQSVSDLVANVRQFTAEIGSSILKILAFHGGDRDYAAKTSTGESVTQSISADVLASLDKVAVVEGNPKLQTIEGRTQFAETLVAQGIVKDVSLITNVMKTGDLTPLTDLDENQQATIKAENELLLQGLEVPPPLDYDYHPSHIRGHMAVASNPKLRGSPSMPFLGAHMAQHFERMEDPMIMARLAILYPNQIPLPALPPSGMSAPGAIAGQQAQSPGGPPGAPRDKPPDAALGSKAPETTKVPQITPAAKQNAA